MGGWRTPMAEKSNATFMLVNFQGLFLLLSHPGLEPAMAELTSLSACSTPFLVANVTCGIFIYIYIY